MHSSIPSIVTDKLYAGFGGAGFVRNRFPLSNTAMTTDGFDYVLREQSLN